MDAYYIIANLINRIFSKYFNNVDKASCLLTCSFWHESQKQRSTLQTRNVLGRRDIQPTGGFCMSYEISDPSRHAPVMFLSN